MSESTPIKHDGRSVLFAVAELLVILFFEKQLFFIFYFYFFQ